MIDERSYVQGFVAAVSPANREAYLAHARMTAAIFQEYGATRIVECWGDDLPGGEITDFRRAVQATGDENVVLAWIVWPSKAVYEASHEKLQDDPRWEALGQLPFDGARMIFGGFDVILDVGA